MRPPDDAPTGPEGPLQDAWRQVRTRLPQLAEDPELARMTLALVQNLGNRSEHIEALAPIARGWSDEWEIALATSSLLIEQAQRRGMDEPQLHTDGPAALASQSVAACLENLPPDQRARADVGGRLESNLGNALRLCGPSRDEEAQAAFRRAIATDDTHGPWWADLGLLHKWRGRFEESSDAYAHAARHLPTDRGVLWNQAICATALGRGGDAANVWRRMGMDAQVDTASGMPFVDGLPAMRLRVLSRRSTVDGTSSLPTDTVGFELVWVAALSPCHGVVQSPTFQDAPIDYGDLVLWDGSPVASYKPQEGSVIPVFAMLEILRRGTERKWPFVGLERGPLQTKRLQEELPDGVRLFFQEERVDHHCPACERGETHTHDHEASQLLRGKLVVPEEQDLEVLRGAWEQLLLDEPFAAAMPQLYETLGDTKRAGQEHQAWRGIERKALAQRDAS